MLCCAGDVGEQWRLGSAAAADLLNRHQFSLSLLSPFSSFSSFSLAFAECAIDGREEVMVMVVVVDICVHTAAVVCHTALCRTFHGSLAVTVIVWEGGGGHNGHRPLGWRCS